MEIKSKRLILTKLKHKDLGFMYKMESQPLVYLYEADEVSSEEQIYIKYSDKISKMEDASNDYLILLISILPAEIPIGQVHIQLNWQEMREWEIGYEVHPDYWGKGYALEAVKLLLKHCFENLNAHKVVGFCM